MDYFILSSPISYARYVNFQERIRKKRKECVLVLEHTNSITAGINAKKENLLITPQTLAQKGIEFHSIKRGGDFTAHEPGQIVIYPHVDLKNRNMKLTQFLSLFQKLLIDSIDLIWNLELVYLEDKPGLYLKKDYSKKLVSFGFNFHSFFTSYGAAINFQNDLSTFAYINPCGDSSKNIVSIQSLGLDTNLKMDFILEFLQSFHDCFS